MRRSLRKIILNIRGIFVKQHTRGILTVLLFTVGICALLYPLVSDWYNSRAQTKVVEAYDQSVEELEEEDYTAMLEAASVYNEGLLGYVKLTDPFDESAESKASKEYESLLNVNDDGVMGYVRIPKIDVWLPIYHGTSVDVMEKGAGHLENTSLPIGAKATHAVISAHTGFPGAVLFTNLDKLAEEDLFFIEVLGETLAYRVDQIKVVEPTDTSDLLIDRSEDYVTLVTCTPYGVNSHRLLVRGVRTEYEEVLEAEAKQEREQVAKAIWNWPYIIAGLLFVLILSSYLIYGWRRRKGIKIQKPGSM